LHIEKKTVRNIFLIAVGAIAFYWILNETEQFRNLWTSLTDILAPFVLGAALAFIMNVPMRPIERQLKFIRNDGLRRALAIVLTLLSFVLVIAGVILLLIPQITETIQALIPKLVDFFLRIEAKFYQFLEANPELMKWLSETTDFKSFDWASLIQKAATMIKNSLSVIATGAYSAVGGVANALVDMVIGIVFSLYCLARKEILARQGRRILYAFLPESFVDETIRVLRLTNSTFSNFISGQCLEAVILGALFAVAMAIAKMPYIPLVSVLIAVTALVPIVGAFVGCILGAFFILVNDPMQAVAFVVMFLVIQQFEGNVIYPKVVGESIGLPGMWVLLAVAVGGGLMGVMGMLLMVPFASVIYTLLREFTNKRVQQRSVPAEKLMCHPPELQPHFMFSIRKRRKAKKANKAKLEKTKEE
jgi:predicted PurR-regulated permease PerM